jgi:hypothetical protein
MRARLAAVGMAVAADTAVAGRVEAPAGMAAVGMISAAIVDVAAGAVDIIGHRRLCMARRITTIAPGLTGIRVRRRWFTGLASELACPA